MSDIRFYDNMLFNYETTYRTDFQNGEIKLYPRTVYQQKVPRSRLPYKPLKDFHTLTEFKTRDIPTELFVKPKDIVRTDPNQTQEAYRKPVDEVRQSAQATRPRLVMTPALSMDDIEDPSVREMLLEDVYKTTVSVMQDGTARSSETCRPPLTGYLAPANPITLPKLQMSVVSPEWRIDSVTWDGRQLRGYCNPDKEFYLSRPPRCDVCDFTADRTSQKKAKEMKRSQ